MSPGSSYTIDRSTNLRGDVARTCVGSGHVTGDTARQSGGDVEES